MLSTNLCTDNVLANLPAWLRQTLELMHEPNSIAYVTLEVFSMNFLSS